MAKLRGNQGNDSGNSEGDLFDEKSGGKKMKITNMLKDEVDGSALDVQPMHTLNTKYPRTIATPAISAGKNIALPAVIQLKGGQTLGLTTHANLEKVGETF